MDEFTQRQLVEILGISQVALTKALKYTNFKLKSVDRASKPVKHYEFDDLPERYRVIIKDKLEIDEDDGVILETKSDISISSRYLSAPRAKQEMAILKCRVVEMYKNRQDDRTVNKWLDGLSIEFDPIQMINRQKLFRWVRSYDDARSRGVSVVDVFLDKRGNKKGSTKLTKEMQEMAVRWIIRTDKRPTISQIYKNMCFAFGDTMPSYDSLYNFIETYKRKNSHLFHFATNPDDYKNKRIPAFGDMSERAKYRNHYWELDGTPADVICSDGRRYVVVGGIDIYSRCPVVIVEERASAASQSRLMAKIIDKYGIPENVVLDNGKDYRSKHFESVCINLGINREFVPPFSGEKKPFIERFFRTLSSQLFEQLEGFSGHSVAGKAEIQARSGYDSKVLSKEKWFSEQKIADKKAKDIFIDKWKIKKENLGLDIALTISAEELQMWCDEYIEKEYKQNIHSGIKTTPVAKWNSCSMPVKGIPDKRALALLLGDATMRKVGKKGISYDGAFYQAVELAGYIGNKVFIMATQNYGEIWVYTEAMMFLCLAIDKDKLGEDRFVVREVRKRSQKIMRDMKKLINLKTELAQFDTTIKNRIEIATATDTQKGVVEPKVTPRIEAVYEAGRELEKKDKEIANKDLRFDFRNKTDGKPTQLKADGKPVFKSFVENFVWHIENKKEDNIKRLRDKYPESWTIAKEEVESKKSA